MIKDAAESRRIAAALNREKLTSDEKLTVQRAARAATSIDHLSPEVRALLAKAER